MNLQRRFSLVLGVLVMLAALPISTTHGQGNQLRWPPPSLSNPQTVNIPTSGDGIIQLETNRDYILRMPNQPVRHALIIVGGRNVVMIGGEIFIPWQGSNPSIASRTGLKIKDSTGTVHIEGLLLNGDDISEGIQINAPRAIVQLQNIGVYNLRARDQRNFSDNHPDIVQTYGNVRELRIDRMTGTTDYQGLFLKSDQNGPHGTVHISRTNIVGEATSRKLLWFQQQAGAGTVILQDVWIDIHPNSDDELGDAVWPTRWGTYPSQAQTGTTDQSVPFAFWPEEMMPSVIGFVYEGVPPGGYFVPWQTVGTGYNSPGYVDEG